MFGKFNYSRMLLAPIGCICQVHVKPGNHKSWDFHSQKWYYLFTLSENYFTDKIFVNKTKAENCQIQLSFNT